MANAGIIIDVQTSGAINSLEKFREALTKSGVTAKSTTEEIQKLEKGFNEKLKADETARKLELARNQIERIGRAAGLSAVEVKRLGDSMGVNMSHMNTGAQSASRLSAATSMLGGSFSSLVPAIGGAVLAYMSLSKAVGAVHAYMERGIEFNKQMESSALGISSILAATQNIATLDGRRLEGQERLNAAMSVAKGLMDEIQVLGVQTTSTTKDLVQGFQTLLGPASEAGLSLGQTKDVVVNIVQAMSALGIKTQELSQEGRALLTGDIDRNARLATSLQITKSMVDEWKSQGTLFENISKKLEAFKLAGSASAQTWEGLTSNIAEAADIISGMGTKGLFEGSKQGFSTILSSLLQIKDDALVAGDSVSNITAGLASMGDDLGGFVAGSAQTLVEKFGELNTWIAHNKEELGEIYDKTAAILGSIIDILGYFGNILTTVISVGVETSAISLALSAAHGAVVLIQETVGYIELAFRAVGVVILRNICGPLASAARLAADLGKTSIGGSFINTEYFEQKASGFEQNLADAEAALQKSASRYSNTPFPAITKANAEVQKLNDNLKETKKQAAGFKLSSPGGYSETDSEKLMKGNGSAQYRLNQEWKEGLAALAQLDAKIKSGTLSNEDMTRALNDQKAVWDHIGEAQDSFEKKANKGSKAAERAAIAAERYSAAQQAFYDQTMASMDQIHDSLTGGFEKNAQGIDKSYERIFDSIRQKVIDAKGDVSGYAAVWVEAWNRWPGDKQLAVLKDQTNELKKQAQLLKDIADATGDPAMQAKASVYDADAWYAERKQQIDNTYKDEAEKAAMMAALQEGYNAKLLKGRADAYQGVAAVSSKYWDAEKQLLAQRLQGVKKEAEDELAFKVYAAQQEDELRKKQLESEAAYAGTFAETLAAKWSLAFGGYKSEMTKSKESWNQMSDSIINSTDGMIDGIAGGFGDMIRNIGNGTASIEDLWKNMLARMLDAFASFVEDLIKSQLKDIVGGLFSGSGGTQQAGGGFSLSKLFGGSSSSDSGVGLSSLSSIGKLFGKESGAGFADYLSSTSSSATMLAGSKNAMSEIFTDAIDVSNLGKFSADYFTVPAQATASTYSAAETAAMSGTSMLGTIGSVLGVVGAIGGIAGLAMSLFGDQNKKKKEPAKPLYDGTLMAYSGGAAMVAPMTVMDDGTMKTKTINPQDIQQTQEAFKELVDTIKDAAKVLKIDLVENFNNSFNFITGVVSDELADSVSWAMEDNLGKQALGGLSEAVMFFSDGMQNVVDVFTELAEATGTVKGSIEALGIDFTKFAAIDDKYIETIANFAVKGTGDLSNAFGSVSQSAMSAAEYIAQYSDELKILAEAQMAKLYQDALGGEDQFNSAMQTYAQYGITTKRQKESSLSYYTSELSSLLGDFQDKFSSVLGDFSGAAINVDNIESFWSAYNAAMQQSMSPKMLAAWAEMASYAKMISDTSDDLASINAASDKWDADIKYRKQMAAGMEEEAALTKQLSEYEQELVQARVNDMTYTQQAALVEAQIAELQKKYNDITGVTVDATSSYSAALEQLSDALQNTIDALSDISSTASSLASTWEGIASSLDSAIDSMKDDVEIDFTSAIAARMDQLDEAYTKGMAGDSDSMANVAEYATSAWEAVKKGATTPEQYDTAYWTIQNRLATAKAASSGMTKYESTIASLTKSLVDIAEEISEELQDDDKDADYLEQSNILYGYVEDFQKYVDLYKAGRITDEAFAASVQGISGSITGWISNFIGDYATVSADQVRALTTEADFIRAAIADGSTMTADQLSALYNSNDQIGAATVEAVLGNSLFLKELMGGNMELSGLSEQQASILSSALSAMETVGKYTGSNLIYSDMANYYLAKISDGVTVSGWSDLITTITTGEESLASSITTAITDLQATLKELLEKAIAQDSTSSSQSDYFASKQQLLYKQTQIELYTSQLEQARSTAAGYQNYAAMALMSGGTMGTIVGMQWLQKYNDMQSEIAKLQSQLDYWTSYTPTAMATGGVVTKPTLAYIGEGGESEAVIPLSQLNTMVNTNNSTDAETKKLLAAILTEMRANTKTAQVIADRVYDRDKTKPYAVRS